MDRTRIARDRRYRARLRGEDIPLRKAGRPRIGAGHLIAYATLPQLVDELLYRMSLVMPDLDGEAVQLTPMQSQLMTVYDALETFEAACSSDSV